MQRSFYYLLLAAIIIVGMSILAWMTVQHDALVQLRLAHQLQQGHGLVYNPHDWTLLTLSPAWPTFVGLLPLSSIDSSAVISSIMYLVSAGVLWRIFNDDSRLRLTLVLWAFAAPLWMTFRTGSSAAFLLNAIALWSIMQHQERLAGLLSGIAALFYVPALVTTFIFGIYAKQRFWQWAWLPLVAWALIAWVSYDDLFLRFSVTPAHVGDYILLLAFAWIIISRPTEDPLYWIFVLWGVGDVATALLTSGTLNALSSPALAFAMTYGIVHWIIERSSGIKAVTSIAWITFSLVLILGHQQANEPNEALSLAYGVTEFERSDRQSILHDRSEAYTINHDAAVYRIGAETYNPWINEQQQANDLDSVIVRYAPDIVDTTQTPVDFTSPGLAALQYEQQNDGHWQRTASTGTFTPRQTINYAYGLDIRATHVQLDRENFSAGETLRLGITWAINLQPPDEHPMTLNISILDTFQTPVVTIFDTMPATAWQRSTFTSYHAVALPDDLDPGAYTVNVTLDYRAGILGQHNLVQRIAPFDPTPYANTPPIGDLGTVQLVDADIEQEDNTLITTTVWRVSESIPADYSLFLHLSTQDDLAQIGRASCRERV
jgi:hypothetical protein